MWHLILNGGSIKKTIVSELAFNNIRWVIMAGNSGNNRGNKSTNVG